MILAYCIYDWGLAQWEPNYNEKSPMFKSLKTNNRKLMFLNILNLNVKLLLIVMLYYLSLFIAKFVFSDLQNKSDSKHEILHIFQAHLST